MEQIIKKYVEDVVLLTFGFSPIVEIKNFDLKSVGVFVDGTPDQRALMMGVEARNFQALKTMIRIFGRSHNVICYLYISPKDEKVIE